MESDRQVKTDPRRALPGVDRLAREAAAIAADLPEWSLTQAAREEIAEARERLLEIPGEGSGETSQQALAVRTAERAARLAAPHPRRVVNATGVVLHTNLGRAPLARGAAQAVAEAAAGYSDLELDLATGRRGDRLAAVSAKLARLAGCEAALAVNNCAAGLMLALNTLARGREVIVSRGELVEIGGSFRVPAIMERAGVRLVEVGATNRTHARDYAEAIGPDSALLLKVHRSNFEMSGFVSEVGLPELAELGQRHGLPVFDDLGSGSLVELPGLPAECFAPGRLRLGADLVCFSGDKLLGGPQAGLLLGSADAIAALRSNPMARALRLDKLSLAALDWTLRVMLEGRAESEIPVLRQLRAPLESLESRARLLAERLAKVAGEGARVAPRPEKAFVGGGSLPGFELPGWVVALSPPEGLGAERVAARLRAAPLPVVARVRGEELLFDVRTLLDDEEAAVEQALREALRPARG